MTDKLPTRTCNRCGHTWNPRKVDKDGNIIEPKVCPHRKGCGSPYWNKPRVRRVKK